MGRYMKTQYDFAGHNACYFTYYYTLYEYARNYILVGMVTCPQKPREFLQEMGIEIIQKKLNKKYFLLDRLCEDIEILKNFLMFLLLLMDDCCLN